MAGYVSLIADIKYIRLIWTRVLLNEIYRAKHGGFKKKQATDLHETRNTLPGIQTLLSWSCDVGWTMTHRVADLLLQQTHVVYGIILQTEFWTRRGRRTIPGFPIDKAPGQCAPHSGAIATSARSAIEWSQHYTTQSPAPGTDGAKRSERLRGVWEQSGKDIRKSQRRE
jgi:hypothetical protein